MNTSQSNSITVFNPMEDTPLTVREVCEIVRLSPAKVRALCRSEELPGAYKASNASGWRIPRQALDHYRGTKPERPMMLKPKNAAWSARAACYGLAPMFDTDGLNPATFTRPGSKPLSKVAEEEQELYATQIDVCRTCPVKTECLADAYEWETRPQLSGKYADSLPTATQIARSTLGIRGGLTPTERLMHYYALCRVRNPYTSVQEDCATWVEARNNPKLTRMIARKETGKK